MVMVEREGDRGEPQAGSLDSHADGQTNKQRDGVQKTGDWKWDFTAATYTVILIITGKSHNTQ